MWCRFNIFTQNALLWRRRIPLLPQSNSTDGPSFIKLGRVDTTRANGNSSEWRDSARHRGEYKTQPLLDKVMSLNQSHMRVHQHHLMFKGLMKLNTNV